MSLLNGVALTDSQYKLTDESLTIVDVPQNTTFTLVIENTINPKANSALEGLFVSNDMLCTQCEAQGFRKITYFMDRPDVMARFTTTLIADKTLYPVLLSNGNKVAHGELIDNRHWVSWEDPLKAVLFICFSCRKVRVYRRSLYHHEWPGYYLANFCRSA